MIELNICNLKITTKIEIICDNCNKKFNRTIKNRKKSIEKFKKDLCKKCSSLIGATKRPQNTKAFWSNEKKKEHGEKIKTNENYIIAIQNKPSIKGENNPMFGKKHTITTKKKMSITRTGKIGENATAWKGGVNTLTRRVKDFQYRNGWYKKVYIRDNFKCVKCESKNKIEAHHIIPIKNIIDNFKNDFKNVIDINNDDNLYLCLIKQDIILDINLLNGITLCRNCHIKEHINMGSHNPKTIKI